MVIHPMALQARMVLLLRLAAISKKCHQGEVLFKERSRFGVQLWCKICIVASQ